MTDASLFVLATRPLRIQHLFTDPAISRPALPNLDRFEQIERTCARCKAVRITSFPPGGGGARLWRCEGDYRQQAEDPGCVSDEVLLGRAAAK